MIWKNFSRSYRAAPIPLAHGHWRAVKKKMSLLVTPVVRISSQGSVAFVARTPELSSLFCTFEFLEIGMMLARAQKKLGLRTLELYPDLIEQRIICAYIGLLFTPQIGACRVTTVGWLGSREVRLSETAPHDAPAGTPPFWLEIYCHASGRILDSCGCFEFDDAELETAVQLVMETGRQLRNVVH